MRARTGQRVSGSANKNEWTRSNASGATHERKSYSEDNARLASASFAVISKAVSLHHLRLFGSSGFSSSLVEHGD